MSRSSICGPLPHAAVCSYVLIGSSACFPNIICHKHPSFGCMYLVFDKIRIAHMATSTAGKVLSLGMKNGLKRVYVFHPEK